MWVTVKHKITKQVYTVGKAYYEDHKAYLELVSEVPVEVSLETPKKEAPTLEEVIKDEVDPELEAVREALTAKGISWHPNAKLETLKNKLEAAE